MINTSIRAAALPSLLADAPQGLKYLSLDCFDTLIWRNVNLPVDVFADLPLGTNGSMQRRWAEGQARAIAPYQHGRSEVTLGEIYAQIMPGADPEEREPMMQAELEAEARHCFAFAPARDLIVEAKRRGLGVVIVSDTYLSEPQLRDLIRRVGGEELVALIDRIFCSSEYGMGKAAGLFRPVLAELGVAPGEVLHVGDNPRADLHPAVGLGMHAVHLRQFDLETEQRLRLEAAVAAVIEPASRNSVPVLQPHRAQLALRTQDEPVFAFGHDVLGPLLHSFAAWIRAEAEAMEARVGKPVKLLFLLRDGYLPARACQALFPDWADRMACAEISRFTAQAASYASQTDVEQFLTPWLLVGGKGLDVGANQLLFDKQETAELVRKADSATFLKRVTQPANLRKILSRSAKMATRLHAHLRAQGISEGDAVLMVDLGYNGSVQNLIEPALRRDMGLTIAGRYLLLREAYQSALDKQGFFDARHYDGNVLDVLYESIAILEQFCTMPQGSVVDYRFDGTPVRRAADLKGGQSACRDRAQEACLAYIREAGSGFVRSPLSDDADARRRAAMAVLARMLALPLASEVAILEDFYHDVNMGTGDVARILDVEASSESLRRRGMFYIKNAMRVYLPGELQRLGVPTNLSLLTAKRFGLDLRKNDFDAAPMALPAEIIDGGDFNSTQVDAHPTADGYYRAMIPVGEGRYTVGLWLGRLFDYVQVEEICFQPVRDYLREDIVPATPIVDAMQEVAPGLYRCDGPQGFMIVPPPAAREPMLLSIVFRPVIARARQAEQRKAA